MGRGTPCPMPEGKRPAIHAQITTMSALGADIHEIAKKIQDIWPGCTANHVRGAIGGLQSKPRGEEFKRRSAHAAMLARK